MKKSWRFGKLVTINGFIVLVLVWSLSLMSSLILDGYHLLESFGLPINKKADTASLKDREHARLVYREKKQLQTRYVPYSGWSRKPFKGETTNVNSDGDRTHPLVTATPAKHAHFFGGSTMWGSGVDDRNTIPAHFNSLFPDYHAHNHGQPGFVSRQGLARLVNLVGQESPMDLVVFYDGCNDSRSLCRADISITGHREQAKMSRKFETGGHTIKHLIGPIQNLIGELKEGERPPSRCLEDTDYAKRVATTLVNNWKLAKLVAEQGGAEFYAILQPVAQFGNPNVEYLSPRGKNTDFHAIYPFVREIAERENIDWIYDFTDAYDGDEYIYIDSCHVNGLGNQTIAKRLYDLLEGSKTAQAIEGRQDTTSAVVGRLQ